MKRLQTFHEILIPLLVEACDAKVYLEFGVHLNETISKVRCERRIGVDVLCSPIEGVELHQMTTEDWLPMAGLWAPYDFVFIDADHRLESVRADFMGIWPFVSPEGMVAVHDVNPELVSDTAPGLCGDSWKLAMELSAFNTDCLTLPYHPGLLLIRKRQRWGPRDA